MIRVADKPNPPKYRDRLVLTAHGYYGDLDPTFHLEQDVRAHILYGCREDNSEGVQYLLDGYDLLRKLNGDSNLKYDVGEDHPLADHPGRDLVPTDEYHFPQVEGYALTYYNRLGVPYNVEVS